MAYDALTALLCLALIGEKGIDKKEFKKRATKVARKCEPLVAKGMMQQIIDSPTPRSAVYEHVGGRDALAQVMQFMINNNYPCFVIVGDQAYPLQIETPGAEKRHEEESDLSVEEHRKAVATDRNWILANEPEISVAAAHAVMNHLNLQRLKCRVHLLRHFGFSGQFEDLEIERGVARKFDIKVGPSSNYYLHNNVLTVTEPSEQGTNVTTKFNITQ